MRFFSHTTKGRSGYNLFYRLGKNIQILIFGLCLSSGVAGCTILTSETPSEILSANRMQLGVAYNLPLSVIDVRLFVNPETAKFELDVSGPRSIPDPEQRYILRYRPLPNYDDIVDVTLTEKSFLQTIDSTTKDQTPDIIVNLFKTVGQISGSFESAAIGDGMKPISTVTFDPLNDNERKDALVNLNQALTAYSNARAKLCHKDGTKPAKHNYVNRSVCARWDKFSEIAMTKTGGKGGRWNRQNVQEGPVRLRAVLAHSDHSKNHHRPQITKAQYETEPEEFRDLRHGNCNVGICYRPLLPYYIFYQVTAYSDVQNLTHYHRRGQKYDATPSDENIRHRYALLPNKSPLVEIDIRRAFFVQKIQKIKFSAQGFLSELHVDKESELEAISVLPVSIITAVAEVLRFRVKILNSKKNEADAIRGLAEQKKELHRQQALFESAALRSRDRYDRSTAAAIVPTSPTTPTPSNDEDISF